MGKWREITPPELFELKRQLDSAIHSNIAYWSPRVSSRYVAFMTVLFDTFRGPGKPGVFRGNSIKYREALGDKWDPRWHVMFMDDAVRADWLGKQIHAGLTGSVSFRYDLVLPAYAGLMEALSADVGSSLQAADVIALYPPKPQAGHRDKSELLLPP